MKITRLRCAAVLACAVALTGSSAAGAGGSPPPPPSAQRPIVVGAAANLQTVLPKIAEAYGRKTGRKVDCTFGATGSLAQQIRAGAPMDLFLSADTSTVKGLISSGTADASTLQTYAVGTLVLAISEKAPFRPKTVAEIADPRIAKIGIANPELAPYGNAARQACLTLGIWDGIQKRLITGENVGQAMTYLTRGEVDVAFVPLSLAMDKKCERVTVPAELHEEIAQALAVPAGAPDPEGGKAFARFMTSDPAALELLTKSGYALPGGSPAR